MGTYIPIRFWLPRDLKTCPLRIGMVILQILSIQLQYQISTACRPNFQSITRPREQSNMVKIVQLVTMIPCLGYPNNHKQQTENEEERLERYSFQELPKRRKRFPGIVVSFAVNIRIRCSWEVWCLRGGKVEISLETAGIFSLQQVEFRITPADEMCPAYPERNKSRWK